MESCFMQLLSECENIQRQNKQTARLPELCSQLVGEWRCHFWHKNKERKKEESGIWLLWRKNPMFLWHHSFSFQIEASAESQVVQGDWWSQISCRRQREKVLRDDPKVSRAASSNGWRQVNERAACVTAAELPTGKHRVGEGNNLFIRISCDCDGTFTLIT